ncbi:transcription elongation factor GreB [Paracraurococcus ruber]|uniref:Transcription elongation factor GreB n=1 Tax=Paracraurococcus ruber TaxID=77675 RepID=A0ABS1CX05_9PROT|nr:transcription elongation factor GreB [Paracraurococcus ruber]MBK1659063.1 transcription elongation factor GreB [Paracraurococcus ruber]TDG30044.1 transcription elongation factor GreB [Paracraurococcus ruber]
MPQDDDEDEEAGPPGLPPGTPFYMTPGGAAALAAELRRLWSEERPKVVEVVSWAAGLGDRSENADYQYGKRRLREIDRRVRFLRKRLERVQVVDPSAQAKRDQVFFGATVTYAREDDREVTVTIVGVDEADSAAGRISWVSPVARTLLGKRVGDLVTLRTPQGSEQIEVVAIAYPAA